MDYPIIHKMILFVDSNFFVPSAIFFFLSWEWSLMVTLQDDDGLLPSTHANLTFKLTQETYL